MKRIILICKFLLLVVLLFGQRNLDSLIQVFESDGDDIGKIKTGILIARGDWKTSNEIRPRYAEQSLQLAKEVKNDTLQFKALQALGNYYARVDSLKAFDYNRKAMTLASTFQSTASLAETYNNLGILHKTYGSYQEATQAYFNAIELNKVDQRDDRLVDNYQNIAAVFELSGKFDQALEYLNLGLQLDEREVRQDQKSRIYNSMGIVYCRQDKVDNGINYFEKALALISADRPFELSNTLNNVSFAYQLKKDFNEALKYNEQAQKIANQLKDSSLLIRTMLGSVDILINDNQSEKALAVSAQGLSLAKKIKSKKFQTSYLSAQQNIFERKGDFKKGLAIQKEIMALQKELTNEEVLKNMDKLEKSYATKFKDQELKETHSALENSQRSKRLWLIFSGLLLLAIMVIVYTIFSRQRLKNKLQVQEKKLLEQRINDLEKQKEVASLHALMSGQEAERQRIAKDLHDGIGSLLSSAKIYTNENASSAERKKGAQLIDRAAEDVRRIAHDMMPSSLQKLGFVKSIEELMQEVNEHSAINFHFQHIGNLDRMSPEKETMLYRITQEILNNIIKHSGAKEVLLQISCPDGKVHLIVEDDGVGFEFNEKVKQKGLGLRSLESRVEYLRGSLDISTKKEEGTVIEIMVPQ